MLFAQHQFVLQFCFIPKVLSLTPSVMHNTPEKDPSDPVMLGEMARPRTLRAGKPDCSKCQLIEFLPPPTGRRLTSFKQRFEWAGFGWQNLKPTMKDRLVRNTKRLIATDEMSGMVCVSHILGSIVSEINTHLAEPLAPMPIYSSTDVEPRCQTSALFAFRDPYQPKHVFQGIQERLPDTVQETLKAMQPPDDCWINAKRHMYSMIGEVVSQTFQDQPEDCLMAPCLKCFGRCRVRPQNTSPSSGLDHGTGDSRDLLINTSGIVCKEFSLYGSLEGTGGKSMLSQQIWVNERKITGEKMCMAECVVGWDPSAAAVALEGQFRAVQVVLDPTQGGIASSAHVV